MEDIPETDLKIPDLVEDERNTSTHQNLCYISCHNCESGNSRMREVLLHCNVHEFDQLVKLVAIIGEKLDTYNNIAVVVSGEPVGEKKVKGKPEMKEEFEECFMHEESEEFDENIDIDAEDLNGNLDNDPDFKIEEKVSNKVGRSKVIVKHITNEEKAKKVYCCDECGKTFKERSSLWRHRKITHEKVEKYMNRSKQVKDYSCPVCSEVIHDTYQKYFLHKQMCEAKTTGINPYVCSICGRSFPTTNQHGSHFTSCSGKGKKYYNTKACSYEGCEFKTSNNNELDNHVRKIHLNLPISKNHVCTLCGNAYNKVAILNQHIKSVHMNEKPHECPTCGKAFARKQKMKDHTKIHTGESKYTCPLCKKSFSNGDSKWNHKKSCPGRKEVNQPCSSEPSFTISIV